MTRKHYKIIANILIKIWKVMKTTDIDNTIRLAMIIRIAVGELNIFPNFDRDRFESYIEKRLND